MRKYLVNYDGVVSYRNVSEKTLKNHYFRSLSQVYVYRNAKYVYDPLTDTFSWQDAKRANRRSGRKAYLWIRSESSVKNVQEIAIYGRMVNAYNHNEYVDVEFSGIVRGNISYNEINAIAPKHWYLVRSGQGIDKIEIHIASRKIKAKDTMTPKRFKDAYKEYLKKLPVKHYKGKSHHAGNVEANRQERDMFKELWEK